MDTASTPPPAPNPSGRSRLLWLFTALLVLAAVVWLCLWFFYLRYYESTDDAYANGNMVNVNSAINGSVIAFYADDTDLVDEGQLLVRLDSTEYQVSYDLELAKLASIVLQVRQYHHTVLVNTANVENKRVVLERARYDYENRQKLVGSKAISNEDFIHARDSLRSAELDLKQAEAQYEVAKDARGDMPIAEHPLIEEQKGKVRKAYYNLIHCNVYAPATGYIAQRAVEVGQWVTPITNLLAIIPQNYVWVDANFKETQLTYMRIGQPATVWFDLYGSRVKYEGNVLGIASGTGSVFSIIPPQNATGNWIKIVQRLPVRISLDPKQLQEYPTRLGISAEVDVNITDQDLPRLAIIPSKKPIATTDVFNLDFSAVDQKMEEVIKRTMEEDG